MRRPGGYRPGAGRKPLPEDVRLRHRVVAFLNDAEHGDAVAAAEAAGIPVGAWARRVLVRALARRARGR